MESWLAGRDMNSRQSFSTTYGSESVSTVKKSLSLSSAFLAALEWHSTNTAATSCSRITNLIIECIYDTIVSTLTMLVYCLPPLSQHSLPGELHFSWHPNRGLCWGPQTNCLALQPDLSPVAWWEFNSFTSSMLLSLTVFSHWGLAWPFETFHSWSNGMIQCSPLTSLQDFVYW